MGNAQQYTVNMWENTDPEFDDKLGWYYLLNSSISSYYDRVTGLKLKGESEDTINW